MTGIGTQICHPWRPRFVLRLREALDYAVFGLKASGSQILFYFYTNVDYPIVGYYFGDHALGLYKWAYEVVLEPVRIISEVVKDVAFVAFSRLKYDRPRLVDQFLMLSRLNLLTVTSYLAFVVIVASELNAAVFGDKFAGSEAAIAVLAVVGVFRAMSYVVPPLLDGMGYPGRTLIYQTVAAVLLPALYWLAAELLGDRLGMLSVACAWAIGYPLAFAVLAMIGLAAIDMRAADYLRRVGGIPLCVAASMVIGIVVHHIAGALPAGAHLAVVAAAMFGPLALLLARTQGITPAAIARAVRGDPAAPTSPTPADSEPR
ncbi:MAG TPA: oligosaccharide flippase family protein [Kofleriaceae bacterium]|nr:oligosaccharide flippase family protein [Kofleriaceae bacterium]